MHRERERERGFHLGIAWSLRVSEYHFPCLTIGVGVEWIELDKPILQFDDALQENEVSLSLSLFFFYSESKNIHDPLGWETAIVIIIIIIRSIFRGEEEKERKKKKGWRWRWCTPSLFFPLSPPPS